MADEAHESAQEGGRIDVDEIRRLLELMSEHEVEELEIEQEELAVRLRKAGAGAYAQVPPPPPPQPAVPQPATAAGPATPGPASPEAALEDEGLVTINSPMVGTFYAAPSPDADAFVAVGDHVTEETVVCVVEAMKVFNEIRAETSGTIEKILATNADPVEFGQPMFAVRPD